MAQLVKIYDCISRYEWNPYRYPSQFIRLKQENWRKLYDVWQQIPSDTGEESLEKGKIQRLFGWRNVFKKEEVVEQEESTFHQLSEIELRAYFLEQLFPLQMKWATSTVSDVSFIDQDAYEDETLAYFLHRFPDIFFVMYYPLFQIKDTPFDGEIILIGPLEIEIIYVLEVDEGTLIYANDERTWTVENNYEQRSIISPVLSLRRNEHIVKGLLDAKGVDLPIKNTVLARNNMIVSNREPYNVQLVGMYEYDKWFKAKRSIHSSLKHAQLQALETLLMYSVSTSVRRPEWEEEQETSFDDE